MKKICMILVLGAFLALMVSLPGVAEEEQKSKVKFSLNVGGMFAQISQGYDFSFDWESSRDDETTWSEAIANIGWKSGFDIGASIFPMPQLEVYASYGSFGGTALGDYTLEIPNLKYELPYLELEYDDEPIIASFEEVENEFKATVINIGLAFHPDVAGKIKPYFGAGLSNVTVKMDFIDSVSVDDFLDVDEYYTWWDYWDYTWGIEFAETIGITGVGFTEESETAWGFHAKAGVNIELAKNISIFVEGRYLSATVEFERPDIAFECYVTVDYIFEYQDYYYNDFFTIAEWRAEWTEEEEFEIDEQMEIKVGGIQGIVGIKFTF